MNDILVSAWAPAVALLFMLGLMSLCWLWLEWGDRKGSAVKVPAMTLGVQRDPLYLEAMAELDEMDRVLGIGFGQPVVNEARIVPRVFTGIDDDGNLVKFNQEMLRTMGAGDEHRHLVSGVKPTPP